MDGAAGEGGGQLLRASLALSMALGRPFRMVNIRVNRSKPGLKRQHLTCLHAAQAVYGAKLTGNSINSMEISFDPGPVRAGEYRFDIGSGGSCTLVLQALVPPLLTADGPSHLTVTRGTHVPHAPPFEFLRDTLFPWLEKSGPRLSAHLEQPGFMQVGGGSMNVTVAPVPVLEPLGLCQCGEWIGTDAHILSQNLEAYVAAQECATLLEKRFEPLGLHEKSIHFIPPPLR